MGGKSKLLITGVSGFIGQALVERLHTKYKIYGLYERPESMEKNPQIKSERKHLVDLRDASGIERVVARIQPDFVIHLAARSEVANSFDNYVEVADINYKGTVILAEALRKRVFTLKLFLMASTMETYGLQPHYPFVETTPQRPMAPYAVAKVASEKYLEYMEYAYSFPFCTLRQTNAYGRKDNSFFVVERMISQCVNPKIDVVELGDPRPWRNFLYIDDLVELYDSLLQEHETVRGETFVTGPENAVRIVDLYEKIAAKTGRKPVRWHTIPERVGEIFYLNSSPAKLKSVLGWEPKTTLDDGLNRTIAYWKDHYDEVG